MAFNIGIWGTSQNLNYGGSKASFEGVEPDVEIINPEGEVVDETSALAEMATEAAEVQTGADEIQRTTAAADIGESVAEAATAIQARGNVTPEEAALVQAGAAQTVAATGAPTEAIQEVVEDVATESYGQVTLSMEGFVDFIKKVWQGIKDFVSKWLARLSETWKRFWNSTASVIKKAKALKEKAEKDKIDGFKNNDAKLEKWSGAFEKITPTNGGKFDPKQSVSVYGKFYRDHAKNIGKATKDVITKIGKQAIDGLENPEKFDASKAFQALAAFNTGLYGLNFSKANESAFGKTYEDVAAPMALGNVAIHSGYLKSGEASDAATLINSFSVKLGKAHASFDPRPKEFKAAPLTRKEVIDLCNDVIATLESLEDWYNKGSKDVRNDIDKVRGDIDKKVESINETADAITKAGVKAAQRLFVIPTQILSGSVHLCMHFIQTSSAMLTLGSICLSESKDKED